MAKRLSVRFYYDIVSPYSYLAFEVWTRYKTRWPINLELKPFFLGGIMNSSGNKPPASVPAKGNYLLLDLSRNSGYFGIPLNTPQVFPANTLSTMRFLTVVSKEAPNSLESLSRCLFKRYWTDNLDVIQNDSIMAACSSVGIERSLAEQWIQLSTSVPIKEELKKTTEEAASLGAFGAPTFFISEVGSSVPPEMFFGSDRFEQIAYLYKLPWYGPNPSSTSKL